MSKRNSTPHRDETAANSPSTADGTQAADAPDALLTTRELMQFLNLSRTKIWDLVNNQDLPAFKIGGDYRYRRSEVLAWLEKHRVQNRAQKNHG